MAETWPVSVPFEFAADGFKEALGDNLLRSPMDVGPDKIRRRSTSAPDTFGGKVCMTATELAAFKTFYEDTLENGSLTVDVTHPRTSSTVEVRYTNVPHWVPAGGIYYWVTMEMEVVG